MTLTASEIYAAHLSAGWPVWIALTDPRLLLCLGMSYGALRQARHKGTFPVKITARAGRLGVKLADLSCWLANCEGDEGSGDSKYEHLAIQTTDRRRPGRPRKSISLALGGAL